MFLAGDRSITNDSPVKYGMLFLERVLEMERGCVEDQPQRVKGSECVGIQDVLRLVGDDTAALRDF